jgi:hypothetical protein
LSFIDNHHAYIRLKQGRGRSERKGWGRRRGGGEVVEGTREIELHQLCDDIEYIIMFQP